MFYEDDVEENHNLPLSHARVIVYYWAGASSIRKINHLSFVTGPSFGHVALTIIPDVSNPEQRTYISFWPGVCQADNHHRVDDGYVCRQHTSHFHTKNEDDYIYQNRLPETIVLDSLDTEAMITSYQAFLQSQYTWAAIGSSFLASDTRKNCVGLSLALLYAGGAAPLFREYYHLGFLSGTLSTLTNLMLVEYIKFVGRLFALFISKGIILNVIGEEQQRLMIMNTLIDGIVAFIGPVITLLIPKPSNYVSNNKRALLAPVLGATIGGAVGAMFFLRPTSHGNTLKLGLYGPFIVPLLSMIGSYISGKIVSSEGMIYQPGFFAGFIAPIAASILSDLVRFNFTKLVNWILPNVKLPFLMDEIYTGALSSQKIINYLFIASTSTILASYITRATLNYLINDAIKTPRDLFFLTGYASNVELLKNQNNDEEPMSPLQKSFNVLYRYTIPTAIVAVSAIGFFAWKNKNIIHENVEYIFSKLSFVKPT